MNRTVVVLIFLAGIGFSSCNKKGSEQNDRSKPNILIIVADDLGYSDIGPFGGNIQTPVLDGLSREGLLFSNFHVLPTCSPTRSALLTGNDNHVAGLGIMGEMSYPTVSALPGYSGHLSSHPLWQCRGCCYKKSY